MQVLLLRRLDAGIWEVLVKPGRRVNVGTRIEVSDDSGDGQGAKILAEVTGVKEDGIRLINFSDENLLLKLGKIPLPPYIRTPLADPERYQTVYASVDGSVAAPTAGLHFTPQLLDQIKEKGVHCLFVTLHVGLDTFRPVREDDPLKHPIYKEYGVLGHEVAKELARAKAERRRILCVGTTTVRIVESAAQASRPLKPQSLEGWINLFILPGYEFRMTDALITNFHLPKTTLLMLVTAFAGKDLINRAYATAIAEKYRFYSFGDAMIIL